MGKKIFCIVIIAFVLFSGVASANSYNEIKIHEPKGDPNAKVIFYDEYAEYNGSELEYSLNTTLIPVYSHSYYLFNGYTLVEAGTQAKMLN